MLRKRVELLEQKIQEMIDAYSQEWGLIKANLGGIENRLKKLEDKSSITPEEFEQLRKMVVVLTSGVSEKISAALPKESKEKKQRRKKK